MNTNQIIKELSLPKCRETISHASKLIKIYDTLKLLKKDVITTEITENITVNFGKTTTKNKWNDEPEIYKGFPIPGTKIKITTATGVYSVDMPINNSLYSAFAELFNISVFKPEKIAEKTIIFDGNLIEKIKKAAKFVAQDDLRPAMQTVCLHFEAGFVQVIGTDCHQMFYSEKIECDTNKNFRLLISDFKAILSPKIKSDNIPSLEIFSATEGAIDGHKIEFMADVKFPDYKCVIPNHKTKMNFDRKLFLNNVKSVVQSANKYTYQVNFHLNGDINMSACDVDFEFEGSARMNYISKDFADLEIRFNGKFLKNILEIFKTENLEMLHQGNGNKPGIFTDGTDNVLLMPLMLNK